MAITSRPAAGVAPDSEVSPSAIERLLARIEDRTELLEAEPETSASEKGQLRGRVDHALAEIFAERKVDGQPVKPYFERIQDLSDQRFVHQLARRRFGDEDRKIDAADVKRLAGILERLVPHGAEGWHNVHNAQH